MELKDYIAPLRKWWWLLVLATTVAAASAFWATRRLPSIYQARTTLIIGRTIYDPNPTGTEIGLSRQLAEAYADILYQEPIANATRLALGLEGLPDYVARPSGNFLEIDVTDTNPERAQAVANELASQLIRLRSGTLQEDQQRQEFINQQLDNLEADIRSTNAEVNRLQAELGKMFSASEIADTQSQIKALEAKLTTLQTNYGTLLSNTQQGATNIISVLSPAALPTRPIGPNKLALILLAAASGCILAGGAAYLLEFLDATIKSPEEIHRFFQLSVIGYIAEMEKKNQGRPYVTQHPHSGITEAFRSLKTNLEFAGKEKPLRTILITSAGASEGKTTVAANLAAVIAQGGQKVVLVDGDLRKPKIHAFLDIPNQKGLSDILQNNGEVLDVLQNWKDANLSVVPAGSTGNNPTELLGSPKMSEVIESLERMADVVIIDGPPFWVSDAWVLSTKVDGVVLVIRPGHTHKDAIRTVVEQVNRGGARAVGVVLNRIPSKQADYYGAYWYISPYANNRYRGSLGENGQLKEPFSLKNRRTIRGLLKSQPKASDQPARPALPGKSSSSPESAEIHESEPSARERERTALELLYAISRELAVEFDLRDLLQRVLRLTLESVGASSGSIMVLDEKGEVIEGVVAYAGKVRLQDAQNLTDTVERGLAGWVIKNRQAALIPSTRDDSRWLSRSWDENDNASRSAVSVPLITQDRVIGVLTLVHPQVGRFTEDDLSLLTAIGVYISFNSARTLQPDPTPE